MNQAELTPIRKHNPKVSRKLSAAIEKSLAVLSEDRYQSSEDFRKALHNARGITRRRLSPEELMVEPPPDIDPNSVAAIEEVAQPNMLTLPPPVSEPVRRSGPPQGAQTPPPLDVGGLLDDSLFDNLPRSKPRRRPLGCGIWVALILLVLAGGGAAAYLLYPDLTRQALAFVISPYQTPTITPEATATEASTATPSPSATPTPTPSPTVLVELTPSPTPTSIAVTPRLTTPTITPSPTRTPIPSPTVTGGSLQIAFVSDRTGLPQIWLMNLDGSGLVQLTNIEEGACQPEWSPTGEQLIFISPCAGELEEYPGAGLFIINADGTGITPVIGSRNGDYDPDWSPDGSQIVFTSLRNNNPQVFLLNLDDNTVIAMTDVGFKNFQPAWSNDGTKIAFISGRRGPFQIWLMDPDGQNQIGFSRSASLKDTNPVWSPDDANILFTQRELPNGFPVIVVAPLADEGFSEFRLTTVNSPSRAADYSPDGQWLVFESWPDGLNHDIYLMNLSTLEIIQLTFDASFEFDPAWRPVP
jgi:Tol biopolymer transport system component